MSAIYPGAYTETCLKATEGVGGGAKLVKWGFPRSEAISIISQAKQGRLWGDLKGGGSSSKDMTNKATPELWPSSPLSYLSHPINHQVIQD